MFSKDQFLVLSSFIHHSDFNYILRQLSNVQIPKLVFLQTPTFPNFSLLPILYSSLPTLLLYSAYLVTLNPISPQQFILYNVGVGKLFSVKRTMVNILGFVCCVLSLPHIFSFFLCLFDFKQLFKI